MHVYCAFRSIYHGENLTYFEFRCIEALTNLVGLLIESFPDIRILTRSEVEFDSCTYQKSTF